MLKSLSEFSALLEAQKHPLYVSVTPDAKTKAALKALQKRFKVPKPLSPEKMHCTLIYSRKPCDKPVISASTTYSGSFKCLDVFHTREGKNCLVVKIDSPQLEARHKALMDEMGASYDFPTYLPHITLSHDAGDFDPKSIDATAIPSMTFGAEECTELNDLLTYDD